MDSLRCVVIDAGHGGASSGAIGPSGYKEKDLTLDIALRIEKLLSLNKNIKVIMTRETDVDIPLNRRRAIANMMDADLFVSIHFNSAPNKSANFTEIYYSGNQSYAAASAFGKSIQKLMGNELFIRRRGFAVIRGNYAHLGAVLLEPFYLSNVLGEKYILSPHNKSELAICLKETILEILKEG